MFSTNDEQCSESHQTSQKITSWENEQFDEAALNDFLGHLGVKDISP